MFFVTFKFRAFSNLLPLQFYAIIETYFLIIDNSEFLTLLLSIEFCSILFKVTDVFAQFWLHLLTKAIREKF